MSDYRRRSRSYSPPRGGGRDRSRSRSRSRGGGGGKQLTGTATRWNERGFCFIQPSNGDEDIFCHFSAIQDGNTLEEGATVDYEKTWDDRKQKYRAENVYGGVTRDRNPRGSAGECYSFRDGNCTRGDSCRFSHSGGGGGNRYGGGDRYGGDRYGGDRYDDRRGGGRDDYRRDDRRGGGRDSYNDRY